CGAWPDSDDSGANTYRRFENDPLSIDLPEGAVNRRRADTYIAEIYHTVDGGQTWQSQYYDQGRFYPNDLYFKNQYEGWVSAEGGSTSLLLHTVNGGADWTEVYYPTSGDHGLSDVLFVTMNEGFAFGMGAGAGNPQTAILHTLDGGANWFRENVYQPAGLMYGSFCDQHRGWTVGGNNLKVSRALQYDDGFYSNSPTPPVSPTPTRTPSPTPPPGSPTATEPPVTPTAPATAPPATPTPEPTTFDQSGALVYASQDVYHAGDQMRLWTIIQNKEFYGVTVDEFIVLELFGNYWFWPSWNQDLDYVTTYLSPGARVEDLILQFTWTHETASIQNIIFWAALLESGTSDLFGTYSWCSIDFINY
ncbi:hypothetical protein JW905_02210, partial [bacterium]|nr:hypothetical protein [candidate division CSSED10-310 bacterium]